MLKIYGASRSRASIVQRYLDELQVPYEFVMLDLKAGENFQAEYTAINPSGKVPAIVDDGFKLWESGAILLYLADKYDKEPLSVQQRAEMAQWVLFANATYGPGVFMEATRDRDLPRLTNVLNQVLEHRPFLMGQEFSAADVAVGSFLAYLPVMLKVDFSPYPAVIQYLERLSERPAFQKNIGGR
jgi:glutathione S-transferase